MTLAALGTVILLFINALLIAMLGQPSNLTCLVYLISMP